MVGYRDNEEGLLGGDCGCGRTENAEFVAAEVPAVPMSLKPSVTVEQKVCIPAMMALET